MSRLVALMPLNISVTTGPITHNQIHDICFRWNIFIASVHDKYLELIKIMKMKWTYTIFFNVQINYLLSKVHELLPAHPPSENRGADHWRTIMFIQSSPDQNTVIIIIFFGCTPI